jgi:pimeloyl-ACP methyl ester carboxylesterase
VFEVEPGRRRPLRLRSLRVRPAGGRSTKHVVFVHGWLGSQLVAARDRNRVFWGDEPLTYLRTMLRDRELLTTMTNPPPLVPGALNKNYQAFVESLGLLGYHNQEDERLSTYIYDWRFGAADASRNLNAHLNSCPDGTAILAHSFGGLVVLCAFASGLISARNVARISKVILIATPFFGTTFALLGLSKSGDFMRKAGEFLPGYMRVLFVALNNSPEFLTDLLAPTFGSFQSLYDMIPHDVDRDDLKVLKVPRLKEPVTSHNWPFLRASPDARRMRLEARRVQELIRDTPYDVPIWSIVSDTEDTAHRCTVGPPPRWALTHAGDVPGDGIVAACCTYPGGDQVHKLIWSDKEVALPTSHNKLLHHPKTHEILRELLQ